MQYKYILLIIFIFKFLYGCTDGDKDSDFKNISLQQCATYTDEFQSYFEKNVTPLLTLAETKIEEISKLIDLSMTNELSRYPVIFRQCNIKQTSKREISENDFSYLVIDIELSSLISYLEVIGVQQSSDIVILNGLVKFMRMDYKKIQIELAKRGKLG